ncbi:MAG TPA: dihydrodipicolinate synthase family protein [Blastocatellia bacterium]|nr:dihydrodipicolinate synthase family protein [Blastocatellia bacterium]
MSNGMPGIKLNGILPPVTTPFNEGGDVDYGALASNIARYNETGLKGYVPLGSNGEAVHLTVDERSRVVETVKRAATGEHTIVAGVNELSTRAAIEAARAAADCGADAVLVITPYFYKSSMTQERLFLHFSEVADHSPLPVLIYNVPQNTGVVIESATIAALGAHQNIIGAKDSAGNMGAISETVRLVPEGSAVMVGNGGIVYPALAMGATGAILGVACAAPRACVELYEAAKAGDHVRARELQNRIAPLSHIVTAGLSVPGLKAAMEILGLAGSFPRAPLSPVSSSDKEKIKAVICKTGLFPEIE